MVQRLQPQHHHKTETLFHQHDLKNSRGSSDLKKKMMKKSGSIKRPKQPEKSVTTPNYMKPTTSSDARKEQSQSQSQSTVSISSISRRKSLGSLKHGVSSGKKGTKSLLGRVLTRSPSFKPMRGSPRRCSTGVLCENLDAQRATCSSTLKDCKFPAYLSLNQGGTELEGTSAVKVCPYTYCSLNGHHHAPLPPLKSFLSARRRAIKNQRSVKIGCLSPRRAKVVAEEGKDFFVEIYSKKDEVQEQGVAERLSGAAVCDDSEERIVGLLNFDQLDDSEERKVELLNFDQLDDSEERKVESLNFNQLDDSKEKKVELLNFDQLDDSEASDVNWGTGYRSSLLLDYGYEFTPAIDVEPEPDPESGVDDEFKVYADGKDCGFDEVSQESYEESMNSDAFSSTDDGESTGSCEEHSESSGDDDDEHFLSETSFNSSNYGSVPDFDEDIIASITVDSGKEPHSEGVPLDSSEGDHIRDGLRPETEETDPARGTAKSMKPIQESDDLGCFNPRGPNFLPLEPELDGEKVDLRHQDLDERKNSEEWMVDYALRQVVRKLGPARKKKVELLVEAFEKVMPTTKFDLQLMPSSAFDQPRTMQACI